MDRAPHRDILDEDKVPRLHEANRRRMMRGVQNAAQNVGRNRVRQKLSANVAALVDRAVDAASFRLGKQLRVYHARDHRAPGLSLGRRDESRFCRNSSSRPSSQSRSESRLRYARMCGFEITPASIRAVANRSALRQTVRATSSAAASGSSPGSDQSASMPGSASMRWTSLSSASTISAVISGAGFFDAGGVAIAEPTL